MGQSKDAIYKAIANEEPKFTRPVWKQVSPNAIDFICKCLKKDPSERPQVSELLEEPWLKEMV